MPPAAAARRGAHTTTSGGDVANLATGKRRTTSSGRAIRTNTTRPTNYYARPYGNQHDNDQDDSASQHPTAFFPALTFFTDAITALPKEVMRHFTLMKEVEAKIHGPSERLGEVVEALLQQPVPGRRDGMGAQQGGLLSLTAANSTMGSTNVSLVNGVAPYGVSGLNSTAGSTVGEESMQEAEDDLARRKEYHDLRMLTRDLLANVDEKNVVLTEANRILNLQMMRLDSVMPHVDAEIPEEARLGSMAHWAYSDNRQKTKPMAPAASERNRRDVAATNSLAAAASAIHETEIATARREAAKEATREKHGKAKNREQLDSEFEERPKKAAPKTGKGKGAMAQALTGLGISTIGEPVKRRKVDKAALPLGMERQLSSTGRGKVARETPRSTPATETVKRTKVKAPLPPPPKRKGQASAQASPALASTPLHSSFSPAVMEPPGSRAQSARHRQNSTATNLRHEALADDERSRPASAAGKLTKERTNGRKRTRDEIEEPPLPTNSFEASKTSDSEMKREDVEQSQRPAASRSNSSNKASGRQSKVSTPRATEPQVSTSEAPMLRTRSTRSLRANGDTPSSEPPMQGRMHKRSAHGGSISGLMKQIAPFNKSPDHHRGSGRDVDDMDDDLDTPSGEEGEGRFTRNLSGRRSGTGSRTGSRAVSRHTSVRKRSRHNTQDGQTGTGTGTDEDTDMPNATHDRSIVSTRENLSPAPAQLTHSPSPGLSSHPGSPANQTSPPQHYSQPGQTAHSSPAPSSPSPTPSNHSPAPPPRQSSRHTTSHQHHHQPTSPSPSASPSPSPEPELQDDNTRLPAASTSPSPDPDDPNEPKYCYCQRGSYGDMVGCDNPKCPREWFHLACTGLQVMPAEEESWFCDICRPRGNGNGSGVRGRGGRGRGRGRGG